MPPSEVHQVPTYTATIYVGSYQGVSAEQVLNRVESVVSAFVNTVGLCVTVKPTTFWYVNGVEHGVEVGLINYPRFPKKSDQIRDLALRLAHKLRDTLRQQRVSIVFPDHTIMLGRR